jgi:capsular exopolysaccharide synthesis family protein
MAAITCLAVVLAAGYSFTRTPMYTARAVVLVQPAVASSQFRPDQLVSLDTEARIAVSAPVAEMAEDAMESDLPLLELLKHVSVTVTPDTLVLDIAFTDESAVQAAAGANAFADAYLDYKRQRAVEAAAADRREIQSKIDELRDDLVLLQDAEPGSVEEQEAQLISSQIAVLTGEYAQVTTETNPGEVIFDASPPTRPSSPKHIINLAMGFLLGAFLAIVLAFVRDRTDERITGRSDFELLVDAPVLATIPHATGLVTDEGPWLVTERQPRSPASEAYRTLRTAVMALSRQRGVKVFAIVSPMLGEGKTTTTANLGVALSHTDSRVLVMTADLRKPALHRCFGREVGIGTADILTGEATLSDAVQPVSPNLWLLTGGRPPGRPAELLQSHRLGELLTSASQSFDFVLVDCPPVLGLADTLVVAPFADAVILVARAESSKRGAIVHAADQLEQVGAMVWGALLNDVPLSKRGSDYGYGYGYGEAAEGDDTDNEVDKAALSGHDRESGRPRTGRDRRDGGDNARSARGSRADKADRPARRRVEPAAAPEAGARTDP